MKKNYVSSFHYLLKYYNKCVRKYQRLKTENASSNCLNFLTKRIEQTLSKILVFVPRLKKQVSLAALAGSFLLISQNSNGQITFGPQQVNPFGLTQEIRVNGYSSHMSHSVFVDIDDDGDLDIIENKWGFGANDGENKFYKNIGNATTPNFSSEQVNPFSIQPGKFECIDFVDLDNDGDLDILTQNQIQISGADRKRDFIIFENTSPSTAGILENNLELKVYPNPVEDFININVEENTSVSLFNILGEEVKTFDIVTGDNQFDISDLPNGVYIVKDKSGNYSSKVVKD